MALMWACSSPFLLSNTSLRRKNIVTCEKRLYSPQAGKVMNHVTATMAPPAIRRSGNYPPSLWSYDHVQSLTTEYTGEKYTAKLQTLKEAVSTIIYKEGEKVENPLCILNLVNDLERLGISYHFVNEISKVLENLYCNYYSSHEKWTKLDLNVKSLGFRILRQHGYHISQEIFEDIKDESGNFKGHLCNDIIGMLNLYEASYVSVDDEDILDDARDITTKYLKQSLQNTNVDQNMSMLISHALASPLQWRVPRIEAKWFIEAYERRNDMNPTLLKLARLDFNMVQAIHLEDLKYVSKWWRNTNWDKKLGFARDRLAENFLWTVGVNYRPQFSPLRRSLAKVFAMITTIDDVYDVYGTLDELEKFTQVIGSWDINAIEELPDYMKICFFGFYNSINEISYETLTNTGFHILPYLKKAWEDLCKGYLVEARWYHNGYTPTFEEYLENAHVTISVPLMCMHINFLISVCSTEEILGSMERTENIIRYSAIILRLADDLGTSSDEIARGDVPKSIQCYMHDTGATEEEARTYVKTLIMNTWKKLNKERLGADSEFLKEFVDCGTNFDRMAQFMYGEVDGHGGRPDVTKSHILSLLVNPI